METKIAAQKPGQHARICVANSCERASSLVMFVLSANNTSPGKGHTMWHKMNDSQYRAWHAGMFEPNEVRELPNGEVWYRTNEVTI